MSTGSPRLSNELGGSSAGGLLWYACKQHQQKPALRTHQAELSFDPAVFTVLGEGLYTRSQLKEGQTGRPSLPGTIVLAAGIAAVWPACRHYTVRHVRQSHECSCVQAVALIEAGDKFQDPGLILGTVVSTILFFANLRRTVDVGETCPCLMNLALQLDPVLLYCLA